MSVSKLVQKKIPIGKKSSTPMWSTSNPFIFCVYHNDDFPHSDGELGVSQDRIPREARDFGSTTAKWKMYHSESNVPGFPKHPHRGFETITYTPRGFVDHADSLGAAGRYGEGDCQIMHAGSGCEHSEMFPLINKDSDNPLRLFQIWLRLPSKMMETKPDFKMLWNEDIPDVEKTDDNGKVTRMRVVIGKYEDQAPPAPPKDSWAYEEGNVRLFHLYIEPGAKFHLPPPSKTGAKSTLWFFSGDDSNTIGLSSGASANSGKDTEEFDTLLEKDTGVEFVDLAQSNGVWLHSDEQNTGISELLLLEGMPINEEVVHHGPFVAESQVKLRDAFMNYQRRGFGGWPWGERGPTFDKHRPRFAKYPDGSEEVKSAPYQQT